MHHSNRELFSNLEKAPAERFVTERDLIRVLSIPRTSLWRLRKSGLPAIRFGRSIRYDLEKVRAWLAERSDQEQEPKPRLIEDVLSEAHWSLSVALDPKHRPQEPSRPSSTARREWWRYPQEAHLLDRAGGRYRRLLASEVAILQGFPEDWGRRAVQDELLLFRGYGDAVPPPLARAIFAELPLLVGAQPQTTVEICAGFGGFALGQTQALAIRHLALIEHWDVACEVLRSCGAFRPEAVREANLRDIDWSEFADRVDILAGGPPCQPWSQAGRGLGVRDERDVLGSTPQILAEVRPKAFVFENVPGLLSGENDSYARDLVERLRNAAGQNSYAVALGVLNAADFGVPQTRRRVFIVGARGKSAAEIHEFFDRVHGRRTHADPRSALLLSLEPWRSFGDAVKDWQQRKLRWYRWPVPTREEGQGDEMEGPISSAPQTVAPASTHLRIGLDWPSRGKATTWKDRAWTVLDSADSLTNARTIPLLPTAEGKGNPLADPWLVLGDPSSTLEALRRQTGREARLVYVDLPRIRTNAGAFDAADEGRVLDTWLSVARTVLRRAILLLEDRGVIAVLCGIEETQYAGLLLKELAGTENYVGTVAWQKGYSPRNMPNMKELSPIHDNILIYARRVESLPPVALRLPLEGFSCPDGDPRGPWKAEQKGANKPDCDYAINICPYRWEAVNGTLPPGIWRINPKTGVIWGVPESSGVWRFTVRVTDSEGNTAEKELVIEAKGDVDAPALAEIPWLIVGDERLKPRNGGKLRIETNTLPVGKTGSRYSACIVATGGSPWLGTTRPGKTSIGSKGRFWEFPASTLSRRAAEDSVDFKAKPDAIPALKVYPEGTEGRLNQTSMWFARARNGSKNGVAEDPADVDYAQDAKKEQALLVENGTIRQIVAASKPAKLMMRLLALFTDRHSTVVDIGSPAAEMASVACGAGRKAIYVALPPDDALSNEVWLPRLRLAARGAHPLPASAIFSLAASSEVRQGYVVDGEVRPANENADVFVTRLGPEFAQLDQELGSVSLNYPAYPAGSSAFLSALASLEGLVPITRSAREPFATSWDGRILALYFASDEFLERSDLDRLRLEYSSHLDHGGRLRVYFHRGSVDPEQIFDRRIEIRRIPFSLLVSAGTA